MTTNKMTSSMKNQLRTINNLGSSVQTDLVTITYLLSDILPSTIIKMLIKSIRNYGYRSKLVELINASDIEKDKRDMIIDNLKSIYKKF
jgi:hypothetical protein